MIKCEKKKKAELSIKKVRLLTNAETTIIFLVSIHNRSLHIKCEIFIFIDSSNS
mgnify:CR=1 FL=1